MPVSGSTVFVAFQALQEKSRNEGQWGENSVRLATGVLEMGLENRPKTLGIPLLFVQNSIYASFSQLPASLYSSLCPKSKVFLVGFVQ